MSILNNKDHYVAPYLRSEREAVWHSVSEPPTEKDGGDNERVLVMEDGFDDVWSEYWWMIPVNCTHPDHLWARTRDVVLYPEEQ